MNRYKVSMSKSTGEQGERAWLSKQFLPYLTAKELAL